MSNIVFPLSALTARLQSLEPYTDVRTDKAASQKETRSAWASAQRRRYKVIFEGLRQGSTTRQDFETLNNFLTRHFGQLDSFLLLDPDDKSVTAHGFGVGDGSTTAFQLQRALLGPSYDVMGGPWQSLSTPRTNLALWSQDLTNAAWTKTACSAALSTTLAPDGTATADKLTDTAATSTHLASQAATLTNGTTYTLSAWVQAAGRTQVALYAQGATFGVLFDLAAQTSSALAGTTTATMVQHPTSPSWWRLAMAFTATASGATTFQVNLASGGATSYLGDGSSGALVWGVLLEAASGVGPYLTPGTSQASLLTTSATVTAVPNYYPSNTGAFEPISDPAPGPAIFVAGAQKTLTTDYSLSSGVVTFTSAPAANAALTWTGSFYRRCRFDGTLRFERLAQGIYSVPTLDLVTVL